MFLLHIIWAAAPCLPVLQEQNLCSLTSVHTWYCLCASDICTHVHAFTLQKKWNFILQDRCRKCICHFTSWPCVNPPEIYITYVYFLLQVRIVQSTISCGQNVTWPVHFLELIGHKTFTQTIHISSSFPIKECSHAMLLKFPFYTVLHAFKIQFT